MRLLLVESDLAVARKLNSRWQREHLWIVRHVRDFHGADQALGVDQFDVVMLGVGLATPAGLAWLAKTLRNSNTLRTLVVSAAWEVAHRVRGLAVADDYVVSPFEPDELDARLERLARRTQVLPEKIVGRKRLRLSLNARAAYVDGIRLNLPPREFEVLALLMRKAPKPVPKADLVALQDDARDLGRGAAELYVSRLRKHLRPSDIEIETVWGVGYRLM